MPKFCPSRTGQVLSESRPAPGSGVPFEAAAAATAEGTTTNQAFQSDMNLRAWRVARAPRLTAGGHPGGHPGGRWVGTGRGARTPVAAVTTTTATTTTTTTTKEPA